MQQVDVLLLAVQHAHQFVQHVPLDGRRTASRRSSAACFSNWPARSRSTFMPIGPSGARRWTIVRARLVLGRQAIECLADASDGVRGRCQRRQLFGHLKTLEFGDGVAELGQTDAAGRCTRRRSIR